MLRSDPSAKFCMKHIFSGSKRVVSKTGSATYYYHTDHLGSSNVITDANGAVVEEIYYFPFGETRLDSGSVDLSYKYTGKEEDEETGLYYYGARYYDPVLARFISPDSFVPDYTNPQSLNRYSYVLNNPLIYIDPMGNQYETPDPMLWESSIYGILGDFGSTWSSYITEYMGNNVSTFSNNLVLKYDPPVRQISLSNNPMLAANAVTPPSFKVPTCHGGPLPYSEVKDFVRSSNLSLQSDQLLICQWYRENRFWWDRAGAPFVERSTLEIQVPLGPLQVTQIAAAQIKFDYNFLYFPDYNIRAGSTYLQYEINRAGGDVEKGLNLYSFWAWQYGSGILRCERCLTNFPSEYQRCVRMAIP
jgi:RHS repeat-associated protein